MSIYRCEAGATAVRRRYRELLDGWPVDCERLTPPDTGRGDVRRRERAH